MNFRRILSKSSLSSPSRKAVPHTEEVKKLQSEIEQLKQTVDSLKICIESKEAAIGTLAREKEKLYVELKSTQRTNRNLQQELADERDIHSKEKDYLIEEIKRLSKSDEQQGTNTQGISIDDEHSLREEMKAKDEVIYNICSKYLKIKSSKLVLRKRLDKLQVQTEKICEEIILILHENRKTLDNLLDKLLGISSFTTNMRNYLKLLKINAKLHYENTQLKICISRKNLKNEFSKRSTEEEYVLNGTITQFSKSEGKLINVCNNSVRHKNDKKITQHNFLNTHKKCSPKFSQNVYRSSSEPCLLSFLVM